VDVRRYSRSSVRRHFALVTQEPLLLRDTVRANVTYGAPDGDERAVWRAIELAGARGIVLGLPGGLDAVLGEGGGQLSGGERQRLCLARAFYRDPRVLVLDEATSSLDSESEAALKSAIAELVRGRTVLLVAHRLSTVRSADRIVVLEDGRIVEDGAHESLWEAGGAYRRLFADQARV
jgi:ABC-type multidrug transport system fused ATPase/permease subunit